MKKYINLTLLNVLTISLINLISTNIYSQSSPIAQNLPYSQNFSNLSASSTAFPAGWQGWKIIGGVSADFNLNSANMDANLQKNGSANSSSEGIYNYDKKIGFLSSTSNNYSLALSINTSGYSNVVVEYDVMTLRNPYDYITNTRINGVELQYRIGSSGNFKSVNSMVYINNTVKQTNSTTAGQNVKTISVTLPDECNNQEVVHLRWISRNVSGYGSIPSFALDNIDIRQNGLAVNYYYDGTGSLAGTSNWGTNTNGSGSHPSNFTSDNQYFNITARGTITFEENWVVSGDNSKIIIGDGINSTIFKTINSTQITGTIDIKGYSTLVVAQTTSSLMTFGSFYPGSSLEIRFAGSLPYLPSETTYENLLLSSGTGATYQFTQYNPNIVVRKNLFIENTIINENAFLGFRVQVGGDFTLAGNASFTEDFSKYAELYLNGTNDQTVTLNGTTLNLNKLTVVNNASKKIILSTTGGSSNINVSSGSNPALTMKGGNIELATNIVTLGSSAETPGTLNYTSGYFTGSGKFARWFSNSGLPTTFTNLFPMGSDTNNRSVQVSFSSSAITSGGKLTISHTNLGGITQLVPFYDNTLRIDRRTNMSWNIEQSGGWDLGNGTVSLRLSGSGIPNISSLNDLSLVKAVSAAGGTFTTATGSITYPQVNRSFMSIVQLGGSGIGNDFFFGSNANSPMPVVLTSFSSIVKDRNVKLMWTTETEINNSGFDIERREEKKDNSFSEWKKIAFVRGNGNSTTEQAYSYNDKSLNAGKYQYRLKQVDYNGNFEYFSLENPSEITIESPVTFNMSQNYPNPSNPKSKINFQIPFTGKVTIKVYDINGKEAATLKDETLDAGFYTAEFDGSNLASGVYFYRLIADSGTEHFSKTMKLILVK